MTELRVSDGLQTFPFHRMEPVAAGVKMAYRLAILAPERPAKVVGATLGLLTNGIADHQDGCVELYLTVTRNSAVPDEADNWIQMKRDFIFYLQRDIYAEPTGPSDLAQTVMLPSGLFVVASKSAPLYVVVGVGNMLSYQTDYDAFGCLYYYDHLG